MLMNQKGGTALHTSNYLCETIYEIYCEYFLRCHSETKVSRAEQQTGAVTNETG